ncbi:MAG: SDR family oxidoreductase [bacterium]|nr:SDR family oxidoreductase [Acidimicrobiia bacterium]MCY4650734.1 SDR family oxidoreductase [bacterium]
MTSDLDSRRAVVTGGAGGLGLVIASSLAEAGVSTFVGDIDPSAVAALPTNLTGCTVDVADADAVAAWLDPIAAEGIDILVNNAGSAGPTAAVEYIDPGEWRRCLEVCLSGHFYCARRVVPAMKQRGGGAIVNITSTAGLMGMPNRTPYVAAKFGVIGLTKTLAMELGRHNIRVNAIAPGSITGDRMDRVISAHAVAEGITVEEARSAYVQGTSMATFVAPQEVADLVLYLVGSSGRSISGQVISVDGNTETLYPRL